MPRLRNLHTTASTLGTIMEALSFTLSQGLQEMTPFRPRLGTVSVRREDGSLSPEIKTPGLITTTSRGVVPHLSRDHTSATKAVQWIQLPFESFLEQNPPIPTLQGGPNALHKFLGYKSKEHLLSLCVRNPADGREMPANGKDHITTHCIRGVRKITPTQWKTYMKACSPDVVTALSDVPFTPPPYSQKRIVKSLERSTAWLADLLRTDSNSPAVGIRPSVLVRMVGAHDERARQVFAEGLVETLYGQDLELIRPLKTLDEGVSGYVFDMVPLKMSLAGDEVPASHDVVVELFEASLNPLPPQKLRLVHSPASPHEILRLIRDIGVDLLDAPWAQRAADLGIALDFRFPAAERTLAVSVACSSPLTRTNGKRDIGHNLFSNAYAHDHSRFSSLFLDAASALDLSGDHEDHDWVCPCAACSPVTSEECIRHSAGDTFHPKESPSSAPNLPYTRAYVHHLLHTHEMSSHALLAMHNLTVVDRFFADIRKILAEPEGEERFRREVERFHETYDEQLVVFDEATAQWAKVERERGKGRLSREKAAEAVAAEN